jgi:DNA polymerase-3 subunit alpha
VTRLPELVAKVKDSGMTACAITDHGSLYAVFKFAHLMHDEGLKPIVGVEMYIAPRDHNLKESGIDNKYYHLTLLAKNKKGYQNLIKISSIGNLEGFYYKPRVDIETLEKYSEGLICLSGCLSGYVPSPIKEGNPKKGMEHAKKLLSIFGDDFYIEIQRNGIELQETVNEELLKIAAEIDVPIVATADVHYLDKGDHQVQEVVWAIADGKTLDDPSRRSLESKEFYLKTPSEMELLFKDIPEAIENTQVIADKVEEYPLEYGRIEPTYLDLPKGVTAEQHLRDLVYIGAKKKYGKLTKIITDRIDYELEIINDKGYSNYFLVFYDFVKYCIENGIMAGARGSAVGTVVGYSLDIAGIDPLKWDLYFERFLNPGRDSPPDIDLDLSDSRRGELIEYAQEKYGEENVRQIIAFSKLQTRQAIRDVARVLDIDPVIADKLSKMVEIVFGKAKSLDHMIENNKEFAEIINSSSETKRLADIVRKVSGLPRGITTHACGLVVTPKPIDEYVAVQRDSKNEGIGMTQFEMGDIEYSGLLKLDFLGLKNMSIIDNALKKIERHKGEKIDLQMIDTQDHEVYKELQQGHTVGVFQLESEGMKKTVKLIKPEKPEDLSYILAAYRPGPMEFIPEYAAVKNGKKKAEYLLDELKPILEETNGVITYQEQVMRIASDIAGYSLADADILRRAMGKKKMDVMEAEKEKFIEGAISKGNDKKKVDDLWELLLKFANYGFNKSHSAAYAMISYYTAYLKHHYALEYMAALLEADLDNFERVILDIQECDRLGIEVLPPAINKSGAYFTVEDEKDRKIRFGLGAIKNVGEQIVKTIVNEREDNGLYESLDEAVYRNISKVQKRVWEYLIMAGALDEFGDRSSLLQILPLIFDRFKKQKKIEEQGQIDLFSAGSGVQVIKVDATPLSDSLEKTPVHQVLQWEKELLGLYFSSHPLDNLQEFFEGKGAVPIRTLVGKKNREMVVVGAMVANIKRISTKKGDRMAFISLEDKTGEIDVIIFPKKYDEVKEFFEPNKPILLAGRLNIREGERSIIFEKAKYIDEEKHGSDFSGVIFKVGDKHTDSDLDSLKEFIKSNPGDTPVKILLNKDNQLKSIELKNKINMNSDARILLNKFS